MDIYGKALNDFYYNQSQKKLWINNTYGEPEEMPVDIFFRNLDDMPEIEIMAMKNCKGKVLDIGAGAGNHSLLLQKSGLDVTALELSATACRIMEQRGVHKVVNEDIFNFQDSKFDTLLLLMNGIGLCGNINGLKSFLRHARTLLSEGGQLIFDSSDIAYLYEDIPFPTQKYYGELKYQYQYGTDMGEWFNWLYVDQNILAETAQQEGWKCQILLEDEFDQYLAKLTL